eukprot:TRINITY_DN666_c0_g1_i2.p1 TRINITY_DN666_c0_g1~~TRINITY_DN666_c0_g1_i2.p1  ORF type:complete len:1257 (-),score=124.52 TRINITY_DN666_c0_g1_i2:342-4112(-)
MTEVETTKRDLIEEVKRTERGAVELPSIENPDSISSLKIKLYYVLLTQRVDLWEEYQRKVIGSIRDETVLRWMHREMKDITDEERKEIALEAFQSALSMKDQSVMADIIDRDNILLQTKEIAELIERDFFEVLKVIIQKPLVISKKIKRDFQCPKYHRAERILNIIGVETKEEHLEVGDIVDYMMDNGMSDNKLERFLNVFAGNSDMSATRSLLIHEKEKIAEKLYRQGKIVASDLIILVALEYKCYSFLLLYMKANNYELSDTSVVTQLFTKVIKLIETDIPHAEIYLYILRKYYDHMPYSSARRFLELVNEWLTSQRLKIPFVHANVNPVKTCVLIIELLHLLKKTHDSLEKWVENMAADLTDLASLLINEVHDDRELHELFTDIDLDGRPMIQIAAFNDVLDVFNHKSITTVTDKIWSGPYVSRGVPAASSSWILTNLIHSPLSKLDLFFRSYPKLFSRDYITYPTHNFQYVTWRDGLQCRYIVESLFYLFLFIYTYYLFYTVTSYARTAYGIINQRKEKEESPSLEEIWEISNNFHSMYDVLSTSHTYLFLLFIVNFRHLFLVIFSFLTDRHVISMYAEITLDTLFNIGIALYYLNVYPNIIELPKYNSNIPVYVSKMTEFWDNDSWIVPLFAYLVIIIFIRTLNTLEVHDVIGPFIEMMKQMIMRVGTFSVLFATLLFFFAMVGALYLPYSLEEFRSLYRSVITLFQTSVGQFDMNAMHSEMEAEIFTVIFVMIFNILLLNLLIAILTQVYTDVSEKAETLYVSNLVVLHSLYAPNRKYSALINSYPPLNFIFGLVVLPFFLLASPGQCEAINEFFLKIEYTFTFILVFAFYLLMELFLYGFCYIKVTIHLMILIFTGREWGVLRRLFHFFLFAAFGLVLLFPVLISDMYYFIVHSYKHPGEARFTDEAREPMSKRVLAKLNKFITDVSKRYSAMPWESLRKSLYDLCAIDIVSQASTPNATPRGDDLTKKTPTRTKSKYRNYKNFSIASQILKQCSNTDDEIVVDLETLKDLLENYTFLTRIQKRQSFLLNRDINEIVRRGSASYDGSQTAAPSANNSIVDRSGAALISVRVDYLENPGDEQFVLMKLFMTYCLEKYTNALISFKTATSNHWLAKNTLLMGQDIKSARKKIAKSNGIVPNPSQVILLEERKTEKKKRGSDPGSREDSLIFSSKDQRNSNPNTSFTMQELDDILKNVEGGVESPGTASKQNSLLLVPPQVLPKSPNRSLFAGNEANFQLINTLISISMLCI